LGHGGYFRRHRPLMHRQALSTQWRLDWRAPPHGLEASDWALST
jgi:hypothetical protein